MSSPTSRSLKWLRDKGFEAQVVEKWNAFAKVRIDLFGWIDIVAVNGFHIVGVQTTTLSNTKARLLKAKGNKALRKWMLGGGVLFLHGWAKKKGKWLVEVRQIAMEDLDA